jgi:hypothetical protein
MPDTAKKISRLGAYVAMSVAGDPARAFVPPLIPPELAHHKLRSLSLRGSDNLGRQQKIQTANFKVTTKSRRKAPSPLLKAATIKGSAANFLD